MGSDHSAHHGAGAPSDAQHSGSAAPANRLTREGVTVEFAAQRVGSREDLREGTDAQHCGNCVHFQRVQNGRGMCRMYNWPVDDGETCDSWEGSGGGKAAAVRPLKISTRPAQLPHPIFVITDLTKVINGVRTVVISDLHLGSGNGEDVCRSPAARERLVSALRLVADRLPDVRRAPSS